MTELALKNPIAVAMACIALIVFAAVVTPKMSVDTFPDLTPPVLVVGTLAPGLGAKDVEKTLTWRIEKYVSATPGVDHVESTSRNNLSVVYVWLAWGTDLNAAQTLVQQQVAFAMSAVPKSLGVLPPFTLQYDPSNAPVVQVAVYGGGLSGPQLYDYAFNNIEPLLEGIPGVASASLNGGRQRQINVVVDPTQTQARGLTSADVGAAVAQSNALLPSGELINPKFDANVYTNAIAAKVGDIGDAIIKLAGGKSVRIRDVARVEDGGSPETQAVSVNGQDADRHRRCGQAHRRQHQEPAVGRPGQGDLRSVDVRPQHVQGAAQGGRPGADPRRDRDPPLLAELPRHPGGVTRDPAVLRRRADRAVGHGPDAQRVHAGRPDPGDGAPRR